jgi:hypothetical protein
MIVLLKYRIYQMVLNDWQRGKLPFFVPPPGCALEPKPEGGEATTEDQPEEEEPEADDDNDDDDNDDDGDVAVEDGSDAETTCTTDTTRTTDTTQTTDSLFENVKFKDYDEGDGGASLPGGGSERSTPVRRPPPINLQAGLEKTRVFFNQPSGFFGFFWGFFGFFNICAQKRGVLRVFFGFKNTFRCIQTLNYNHSY